MITTTIRRSFICIIGLTSLTQSSFANQIAESQQQYVKKYAKQANIPAPEEMLINTDTEPDLTQGFINLYNGRNLDGWNQKGGAHKFESKDGVIVGTCVPDEANAFLCTDTDYSNFIFSCEIKWEVDGNSGVMFRARVKDQNGKPRVYGPQCEMEGINNSRGWSSGIYGEAAGGWIYPLWLEAHDDVRLCLKKDGWNRLTIKADGDTIKTWLNGLPSAHWKTTEYMKGFIGLQVHKGKNGIILFRNIKIKEL
ncbi:DUF1080 domain-containing protein [Pontiellaceae bacterium B12219]|nr:DUF1080 domain-containing protein [Pontiellaceae bacterium B12219]